MLFVIIFPCILLFIQSNGNDKRKNSTSSNKSSKNYPLISIQSEKNPSNNRELGQTDDLRLIESQLEQEINMLGQVKIIL
jgi:hypothetical protein